QVGEQESEILASMRADAASVETAGFAEPLSLSYGARQGEAEARLIEQLKALPFNKTEDPVARLECVLPIFRNLLKEGITELPSVPKLMLFEMQLVALCGGSISSVQWALLKEFQRSHG